MFQLVVFKMSYLLLVINLFSESHFPLRNWSGNQKKSYRLFDIGGQKIDRRKWALQYEGIDAIFFCIAISEYDQVMSEDMVTVISNFVRGIYKLLILESIRWRSEFVAINQWRPSVCNNSNLFVFEWNWCFLWKTQRHSIIKV